MAVPRRLLLLALSVLSAVVLLRFKSFLPRAFAPLSIATMSTQETSALPKTQADWRKAIEELPATPEKIPAFFLSHGSPMLAFPPNESAGGMEAMMKSQGPRGSLAAFLKDFGPALLEKYKPKGLVVFSAHWDTSGERLSMIPPNSY